MNQRLQKKCVFAATGFHLLLLTILIVGPAFFLSERQAEDMPMLDFVPQKTIDEAFSGGGSPQAQPPAPQPPAPQPEAQPPPPPAPAPVKQPDPPKEVVKETVKETKPEAKELELTPAKPRKPEISLKKVVRNPNATTTKVASTSVADAEAKARADAKAKQQVAFRRTLNNLNAGLSSSTTVEMPGPGGGGPSYANFQQALRKIYTDAWIVPDGITDDDATVTASVTIARDGDVLAAKVLHPSGNAALDASIEATLRRVTHAVPLPDSAKESQRTVNIKFNVRSKLNG